MVRGRRAGPRLASGCGVWGNQNPANDYETLHCQRPMFVFTHLSVWERFQACMCILCSRVIMVLGSMYLKHAAPLVSINQGVLADSLGVMGLLATAIKLISNTVSLTMTLIWVHPSKTLLPSLLVPQNGDIKHGLPEICDDVMRTVTSDESNEASVKRGFSPLWNTTWKLCLSATTETGCKHTR